MIRAIGAWIVCFKKPRDKGHLDVLRTILSTVHEVLEHHTRSSHAVNQPLLLAVGMQQALKPCLLMESEEWDDLCMNCGGWEWIDGEVNSGVVAKSGVKDEARNDFGEKVGLDRLQEALEANEWEGGEVDMDKLGLEEDGFGFETGQMEREMMDLKIAVEEDIDGKEEHGEEDEKEGVEGMEGMMLRMQMIKDMGADMPEAERKRFAAKAVRDMIKTL